MKPLSFQYLRAQSLDEVVATLVACRGEAKILAGGQSLVPMLNLHLTQPEVLVDIARVPELSRLDIDFSTGRLVIGAMVRQATVEHSELARRSTPLLTEALAYVAHPAIRHRGTLVGNAVHADPASEVPAVLLALDAECIAVGSRGERRIPVAEFYVSALTTALNDDELVVRIEIPIAREHVGTAWVEMARTHGNYALVGVGCQLEIQASTNTIHNARIALCGIGDVPVRSFAAELRLNGTSLTNETAWHQAVQEAAHMVIADTKPASDIHASATYRQELAIALTRRAIAHAVANFHVVS